jgi:hypothetical protein
VPSWSARKWSKKEIRISEWDLVYDIRSKFSWSRSFSESVPWKLGHRKRSTEAVEKTNQFDIDGKVVRFRPKIIDV